MYLMVLVFSNGMMVIHTKDILRMDRQMVKASMYGPMVTYIMDSGKMICSMIKVNTSSQVELSMKDNTAKEKGMEMEPSTRMTR